MSNELATMIGDASALRNAVGRSRANVNKIDVADSDGGDFLKLNRAGQWLFGKDNHELDTEDCIIQVDPLNIFHGYNAFDKENNLAFAKELGPDGEDLYCEIEKPLSEIIQKNELREPEPVGRGNNEYVPEYKYYVGFRFLVVSGADKGKKLTYKQSTYGANKFGKKLSDVILDQIASSMQEDAEGNVKFVHDNFVPVIKLDSETYPHKQYGQISNPLFDILEWVSYSEAVKAQSGQKQSDAPQIEDKSDGEPERETKTRSRRSDKEDTEQDESRESAETEARSRRRSDARGGDSDSKPERGRRRRTDSDDTGTGTSGDSEPEDRSRRRRRR